MRPRFFGSQEHLLASPGSKHPSRRTGNSPLRRLLGGFGERRESTDAKRGRLLLETLESRQMMAGDVELLYTGSDLAQTQSTSALSSSDEELIGQAEGEPAPDLVAFAKALDDAGVQFFGAAWCPFCSEQKQLFEDGDDFLPFIEVTGPDRQLNSIGISEGITQFPTWKFTDGTTATGVLSLATLSQRSGIAIPTSETPSFAAIGPQTVLIGSPLNIPVNAYDPNGGPLTVTVTVDNPNLLEAVVRSGNRSIRIDMNGYDDMVFELFEDEAPRPAGRVIELANSNFYDGIIFHRVVNGFVIQAGDPTGTGTSGSTLGNFDDQFSANLQHNRSGVLSFAKTTDDTNNSQFFITETPTRHLDFNHSIFGQLVEGDDVREAISGTAVDSSGKPATDVTITSIDVFNDTENSVVMLKARGNATGTTNVRFTVTDAQGNTFSEVVPVTIAADTANSQPFLNQITTPATSAINTPATLQLSSVDVEGDAVTYTAAVAAGSSGATATVNAATGLVTVTPTTGFTGTVNVVVGVRPGTGVTGNVATDADTQTVAFKFEGEQSSAGAPTGVDLLATSDTGISSTDNTTNAGSLTFTVSGVTNGATVELVRTGSNVVIGTGIATGTTINITTSNIAALGDGTYSIAARQIVGGVTSSLSPALSLIYDRTNPASVVGSASTQANVGRVYTTDLVSPEEGSGLRYALTAMPSGATINESTGVINWTPSATQTGANVFTLQLTDVAGNVRTESFTVTTGGAPQAEVKLQVTDLNGNEISNVNVGDTFLLRMIGVDARSGFDLRGLFAAAADVTFDSTLIRPAAGATIEYATGFTTQRGGVLSTGLIDELGAARSDTVPSNVRESLVATIRMTALAAGTVNIASDPAENVNSEVLLYSVDNRIPPSAVAYGNVSLSIGQGNFTLRPDSLTVVEDSAATVVNVLANDVVNSGSGTLSVTAVSQPTSGGTVTLSGGQVRFTPTANFNGTAEFTYTAAITGGGSQTGTVTVTVTPVNDPPTGVADSFTVDQDSAATDLDVLANDSIAPDTGETLRITRAVNSSAGSTISVNTAGNRVSYRPPAGFIGTDTFTYTVSDGVLTRDVQVTVNVRSTDAPPTAVADAFTVVEDAAQASFDVMANDTRDASNQAFVISAAGVPSQGGTASVSSDGTRLLYQPKANFNGTETVTYTIRDTGSGSATGTVTFTVTSVNDVPQSASPTQNVSRTAGETLVFSISDLPANPDTGETLRFTAIGVRSNGGAARISSDGTQIFYTPPSTTFTGADTFTYTVSDPSNLTSTGTITIQVNDFTMIDVPLLLGDNSRFVSLDAFTLSGTDVLGATVSRQVTSNGSGMFFQSVLPGTYTVNVPAVPFLQGGDQPQTYSLVVANDSLASDVSVSPNLGSLRAKFVSMSDWFGSSPKNSILAGIIPGQSQVFASLSAGTSTITSPTLALDSTGATLTVSGKNSAGANVSASLPTTDARRVQPRGQVGNMQLVRVSVETADVTFNPVTTTTQTSASDSGSDSAVSSTLSSESVSSTELLSGAEGELIAASSPLSAPLGVQSVASQGSSSLSMGAGQPIASDSPILSAVSRVDVNVPSSSTVAAARRALASSVADTNNPVDAAMSDVMSVLTLRSATADSVAEARDIDSTLDESMVDEALRTAI